MRLLVTETLDPDGAMHRWCTPDLVALGHEALALPTQELAPLLGPDGLAAWILAVAEHFRPDLVLLCPPYDHVSRATLATLEDLGAQTVAYCFDEPLFPVGARRAAALTAYHSRFATAPDKVLALPGPTGWLRWAASPDAFAERAALHPSWMDALRNAVVLVGRPYQRRLELVAALAEHNVPVVVFGHGWVHGAGQGGDLASGNPRFGPPLTGPEMHAVLAAAGLVLTTGDWEGLALPMVKYRLLEAALCGAPQVVQRSPDLASYFEEGLEVAGYESFDELAEVCRRLLADPTHAKAMAERARTRALREHSWRTRFGELLAQLDPPRSTSTSISTPTSPARSNIPPAYLAGLALIAHDAERRGATRLAHAAFALWERLAPNPTACAGLARLGSGEPFARQALQHLEADPRATSGLYARLPTSVGTGLGQIGFLDPSPELLAMRLAALLDDPDAKALNEADALIAALRAQPELLVATAALLVPDGEGECATRWRALFAAALDAHTTTHDFDEHRPRWREAAGR